MNLNIKKYSITLILSMLVFWYVNNLILNNFPGLLLFSENLLFKIYLFLVVLNIIHFFVLKRLFIKWIKQVGFIYMALSFIKMLACILFIVINIFKEIDNPISAVLNFMVVYFITLFIEVFFVVKNMAKKS